MDAEQAFPSAKSSDHSRKVSHGRRQALLRHSSRGPLDDDDPLQPSSATSTPPQRQSLPPSSPPSRNSISSSANPSPSRRPLSQYAPSPPPKAPKPNDFAFLLRPQNWQTINPASVLASPFTSSQPPPDTPLPDLLRKGHHIAAANAAATLLIDPTQTTPSDHAKICSLIYARFASLQLCGQTALAARESRILGDLNDGFVYRIGPEEDPTAPPWGRHLVPWELRVMCVRLQALGFGDWRRGIMQFYELAREARWEARRTSEGENGEAGLSNQIWEEKLTDLGLRVADALVEVRDFESALVHLRTLMKGNRMELIRLRIAMLMLRMGDVTGARIYWSNTKEGIDSQNKSRDEIVDALCMTTEGEYDSAAKIWENIISAEEGSSESGIRTMACQNLAVCLVYIGQVSEAQTLLQDIMDDDQHYLLKGVTFNISTIYELAADMERCKALKLELAETARERDQGDRALGDFKL